MKTFILMIMVFFLFSTFAMTDKELDEKIASACAKLVNNNRAEAIAEFSEILNIRSNLPEVWYNLGNAWFFEEQMKSAEICFREALKYNKSHVSAMINLANVLSINKQDSEAIRILDSAQIESPENAMIYTNRGICRARSKMYVSAVADFTKALQIEPEATDNLRYRASAYSKAGKFREALKDYHALLLTDSENHSVLNGIAWLYATCRDQKIRNGSLAFAFSIRALKHQRSPEYLDTYAAACAESGNFDLAVSAMEEALQVSGNPELKKHLEWYKNRKTFAQMQEKK